MKLIEIFLHKLTENDLKLTFQAVLTKFKEWIGSDYTICSWSAYDL